MIHCSYSPLLALLLLAFHIPAMSADMKCIAPPVAVSKDLKTDIDLKIAGIKNYVGSADFSARVGLVTTDLYSKYPNADRLVLSQAMLSSVCSLINSVAVPDREKIQKYADTESKVLALFTNLPSRASAGAK